MHHIIAQLTQARLQNRRISGLNPQPASVAEAHDIQDMVAAALRAPIGGFKCNAPPNAPVVRGAIYASAIHPSPATLDPALTPDLAVEGEIAFRFTQDLPPRPTPYSRDEVIAAIIALPAVEIVSGRLTGRPNQPELAQLADCLNNGGLITGPEAPGWRGADLASLRVTAYVNGEEVWNRAGGHPNNDPLEIAVAFANLQRAAGGIPVGQLLTTGSSTGIRTLKPGDNFAVAFETLGRAELTFAPGPV